MVITHKLHPMELTASGVPQRVDVMQDDKYSRNLQISLYENGTSWEIPRDVVAVIRYKKSDGTGGNYDTLPDGSLAYSIRGNVLTIALAPQVCTYPGPVMLAVGLILGSTEINTFTVNIVVQPNPGIEVVSENYSKIAGTVADSGWMPNMYLATDEDGNVVARTADDAHAAAERAIEAARNAEAGAAACQNIAAGINSMPDSVTGIVYTIGVENGIVFLEEV